MLKSYNISKKALAKNIKKTYNLLKRYIKYSMEEDSEYDYSKIGSKIYGRNNGTLW